LAFKENQERQEQASSLARNLSNTYSSSTTLGVIPR